GTGALFGLQLLVQLHKGIADVLEEDEAEHDVLVLRRINVLAELVGRFPELLFAGFVGGGFGLAAFGLRLFGLGLLALGLIGLRMGLCFGWLLGQFRASSAPSAQGDQALGQHFGFQAFVGGLVQAQKLTGLGVAEAWVFVQ